MITQKPNSVYVTIRDGSKGPSKSLTIYGSPADDVFGRVEQALSMPVITDAHPSPAGPVQDHRTSPVVPTS